MKLSKYLIFTFLGFSIGSSQLSAQARLSLGAAKAIADYESAPPSRSAEEERVLATIELRSPEALDSLRALGAEVKTTFGSFAIVALPIDRASRAAGLSSIKAMDFGTTASPLLDKARIPTNVNTVQTGSDPALPQPFTGRGVAVGIVDQGFDPLHPAFIDAEGAPRVKSFTKISKTGNITTYSTEDELRRLKTEDEKATHATHVTGIAAGGIVDHTTQAILNEETHAVTLRTGKNRYYGVATDADILMAGGSLELTAVTLGVKALIDNARQLGMPAVVNMSLGLGIGPHNGQTVFSRSLAELGKEAIIVVAAGNEGDKNVSVDHVMDASRSLTIGIDLSAAKQSKPSTQAVEIYGTEGCSMSLYLAGYSKSSGDQIFRIKAQPFTSSGGFVAISQAQLGKFSTFFAGTPKMGIGQSEYDDGPYAYIDLDGVYPKSDNTDVILALDIKADEGARILAWANDDTYPFTDGGIPGLEAGSPDLSISDLATGDNILTVGAFNTRDSWPALDKALYGYKNTSYPELHPSDYSSYGILPDGRSLPHVAAPGTVIISALNRYYTKGRDTSKYSATVKSATTDPDAYYGNMMGTSMATPFMTGVVALWLEANPGLTIDDIHKIVEASSIKDDIYHQSPLNATKLGAGRVDALAGIKMALEMGGQSGISDVASEQGRLITTAPGSVSALFAGARSVSISLFTPSGAQVAAAKASSSEATIDTSALAPGIYIVSATDGRSSLSRKIAVN